MYCIECENNIVPKYKCPICRQPYCSVECYKKHKLKQCSAPEPPTASVEEKPEVQYDFPTEDTVPPEKLKLLEQSPEVKECLANPHVRKILEALDKDPHPDQLMEEYMQEPIFTEFVNACLDVVQPPDDK